MYIVFEGIHDVGKTTLINSVCDHYYKQGVVFNKFECRRSIPELSNAKNVDLSNFALGVNCSIIWFMRICNREHTIHTIFDRLHLSEYAYSQTIRDMNRNEAERRFEMIDGQLSMIENVKLIYLTNDLYTIQKRTKARNKDYNEKETIKLIQHLERVFLASKIRKKIMIKTDEIVEKLTDKVVQFLEE